VVAIVGFKVAFIGPIALIALAVFVGIENKSVDLLAVITNDCDQANTPETDPFTDVSVQELQQACIQDNTDYFNHILLWTALRAVFQVPFPDLPTLLAPSVLVCVCVLITGVSGAYNCIVDVLESCRIAIYNTSKSSFGRSVFRSSFNSVYRSPYDSNRKRRC